MTRRPPAGPILILLAFLAALAAALLLVHTARGQTSPEPGTRNPEQREVSASGSRASSNPEPGARNPEHTCKPDIFAARYEPEL